jgi:hypothetical protein
MGHSYTVNVLHYVWNRRIRSEAQRPTFPGWAFRLNSRSDERCVRRG